MSNNMQILIMVITFGTFRALAFAFSETANYYTPPYVPSSCYGNQNNGVMIAAASDAFWNNRAACGQRYKVTCTGAANQGVPYPCTGQSAVVTIVDYCGTGCRSTIVLSKEAFATIADPDAGNINVDLELV